MLSIGKLTGDRVGYYEQAVAQGRDDYYAGKGEAVGEWLGEGADALGLEGDVGSAEFERLMAGNHPASAEPLIDARGGRRIVAYDLTFSAPKSLSVLYAIADDDTSAALRDAHDEAVRAAVGYLEEEACKVRRGAGGAEIREAGGFVSAAYRHRMSRATDPQLHTHVVTANVAQGPDGRWSGLWGTPLYRNAKAAGYLYQAHLRAAVRERLPWARWSEPVKGAAEIVGVTDEVLREFSKRRIQIEEWLEREGRAGRQSAEKATLASRQPKDEEIQTASWRERTRARAAELGLGRSELTTLAGREPGAPSGGPVDEEQLARRLSGEHGLTAMQNTFAPREVALEVAAAHRDGLKVAAARAKVGRYLERSETIRAATEDDETLYTTADLLEHELTIVAGAERGRGAETASVPADLVERTLADRAVALNEEQRAAVAALAQSGRGVDTVEALAGTGKTTLAGALREVYEAHGVRVIGAAPTARAARELEERGGIAGATTLARLRMDLAEEGFGRDRPVVIIDEASMAATRDIAAVIAAAERDGAKVIAIGDSGQLPSVQAGGWLGSLSRRYGSQRLTEVMRQRDPIERGLLARVHAGEPAAYVRRKEEGGELRVFEDAHAAERSLIADWCEAQSRLPYGDAAMIARDNATRERLNAAARERLREAGRLGDSLRDGEREFAVGDRVIARRNDRGHDVDNGMRATVRSIKRESGTLVVETDASGLRELPASYVAEYLEHAYALTGHGMQGGTVEWAGTIGIPSDFSKNWSYTALSRARETTRIYLVDEQSRYSDRRAEIAPDDGAGGRADPLVRMERRMRTRDDEDLAIDRFEPPAIPGDQAGGGNVRVQEAGASALAADPAPPANVDAMRRELAELDARLAAFPRSEERALERASAAREASAREVTAARERARRLTGDEPPREVALADQALEQAERTHLSATKRERELLACVPDRRAWEHEVEPLRARREQLRREFSSRREQWVEVAVASPGSHLTEALGPRPADRRGARTWTEAARAIERYRFERGVRGRDPLGSKPRARVPQKQWREASRQLERAQRQLGKRPRVVERIR